MTHAYTQERIARTIYILSTSLGTLRKRLPEAYDEGLGSIAPSEFDDISADIGSDARRLKQKMYKIQDSKIGYAQASVSQMSDDELVSVAVEILDIASAVEGEIQEKKRKP